MTKGNFYFILDSYFDDFPDSYLMKNKEFLDGKAHDRPCFYCFLDKTNQIYWMIPFSSKTNKYHKEYDKKISKYGRCDTIDFGNILGHEKAFLIQNICPVTLEYIGNKYIDKNDNNDVRLDGVFERNLINKAKKVLALQRKGYKLIFPNVMEIETKLINKMNNNS